VKTTNTEQLSGAEAPTITIQPTTGWGHLGLADVWEYRDLLWFQTLKNIKAKYRQMALGPLWIILQPMMNMVVFTLIFGKLARMDSEGLPYPVFTYIALIPWTYFSNACTASCNSLVAQMGVISKVYFPRLIIPASAVISGLVDFCMCFLVLCGMMAWYRFVPGWHVVFLPLFLILGILTALAIGLWTASLTVRFRDLRLVVQNGMRIAMYLTPVAYSATEVSKRIPEWMWLYKLNPMFWVVEGFRWCLVGKGTPPEPYMLLPFGLTILLVISGAYMFRRTERTIVDLL
jgi:lipopolysaccharide transport system permease protein